jgi:DNA polymerase (family 10)
MEQRVTNAEAARALRELALFLEMDGVAFKPRAYEKAALQIEQLARPIAEVFAEGGVAALEAVPGVGRRIAMRLASLLESGRIEELESLRRRTPVDVLALAAVEGVGPRSVRQLYEALGIRTVAELKQAASEGRIRGLPHFGERSEQRILRAITFLEASHGRIPLGEVLDLAQDMEVRLGELPGVERAALAGSLRRRCDTIGDLDFVVAAGDAEKVIAGFVAMPEVAHVYARGDTKALVRLQNGLDADLRAVPRESFGAALLYFTGSKEHNVALRRLAQDRGLKLSEYGLYEGERAVAGASEEEVYAALGLARVPPELRENTGEIEAAQRDRLPLLVEAKDLQGDVQIQTRWTDGEASIEEMAEEARRLGRHYIAITDHTRDLAMTGGLDEERLLSQAEAIRKLEFTGLRVLAGAEVNIRRDGTLDIADEALARLDVVGASVHSHFDLPREEMTRRLVRAMENPHVDILFHPTCRRFGKRPEVQVDLDALFAAALRTGTALEIDAHPGRLDLRDDHVRRAVEAGVALVIDSDAHAPAELRYPDEFGVAVARRGWARRRDVLNTLPLDKFIARLKGGSR